MIEKQFEYKQVFKTYPGINITELNEYGKDRWELCGTETNEVNNALYYTFKREIIKVDGLNTPIGFNVCQTGKVIVTGKGLTDGSNYRTIITDIKCKFQTSEEKEIWVKKFTYARMFLMLFHKPLHLWDEFISESEANDLYIQNHEKWNFEQKITFLGGYDYQCEQIIELLEKYVDNTITEIISIELRFNN